jgi:hypothetical protein
MKARLIITGLGWILLVPGLLQANEAENWVDDAPRKFLVTVTFPNYVIQDKDLKELASFSGLRVIMKLDL